MDQLTERLRNDPARPEIIRGPGALLVQMTVDGRDGGQAGAESRLRGAAGEVWVALGLLPFTIAFVETLPESGR